MSPSASHIRPAQPSRRGEPITSPIPSPTSSTSSFHSARSSRSVSPDRIIRVQLAVGDTDPAEPQVQVTQQNMRRQQQQQQRKPFRDTQLERIAHTTATLGNATIEAFALSESVARFLAQDERLATLTSPVYHRQRPGCTGEEEESLRADLTLDEMLHLHVHAPLDRLSMEASDLKAKILLLFYQDGEQAKAKDSSEQEHEDEIQDKVLALSKAASALSNLVAAKLRPWKRVCDNNPKMDYVHKKTLVELFASGVDAWLRDQYAPSDR